MLSVVNKKSALGLLVATGCVALSVSVGLQQGLAAGLKEFGWWALLGAFIWWLSRD